MAIEITSESLAGAQPEPSGAYKESPLSAVTQFTDSSQRSSRSRSLLANPSWTRRNFSSRARELSGGEVIILSIPKSGRTWLRAFLCAYFCRRFGLEFTLRTGRYDLPGFPRVVFSHDLFEHWTKGDRWDRVRGKYLVPRGELKRAKIILLARDPLEFSRFENMQKLEAAGAFDSNILHPGDVRDPESFKVRRGKVGGYREYLSAEDQQCAANAMTELDRRFGYIA